MTKTKKMAETYKDLTIYPLNIDTSKLNEIDKYPLCSLPHLILLVGRVKSGKSSILNSLYLSEHFYSNDFEVKILVSPSAYNDPMNQHILEYFDYIFTEYSDELIDELLEIIKKDKSEDRYILVFDDMVGTGVGSKRGKGDRISQLSTMYRHVGNETNEGKLSICIAVQYFKYITPILRNQCSGIYICGSFTDRELGKIAEAYAFFGNSEKRFLELYREARKKPFDFLFLNVHSLEARQNHDKILWSYDEEMKKNMATDDTACETEEIEKEPDQD